MRGNCAEAYPFTTQTRIPLSPGENAHAFSNPNPPIPMGKQFCTAVLLCNRHPDAPTGACTAPLPGQFLPDQRVGRGLKAVWWFILHRHHPAPARPSRPPSTPASGPRGLARPGRVDRQRRPSCCAAGWAKRATTYWCARPRYGNPVDRQPARCPGRLQSNAHPSILPLYPQYSWHHHGQRVSTPCTPGPGASA